ncbi:hypothetical protein Pmani_016984 [Petrolisthes manimaculis]|uniref:Ionotropic glutamate receptor L-glutamate and glycine-binding domain-containing protein n=1 Tax=Petrolisthes manimaculis TaxID=1843537 RepID=A0AAE1PPA1_9EUCA|nr:hypothetical protein Pmani_016984 [Petrolisthes manimaculis]
MLFKDHHKTVSELRRVHYPSSVEGVNEVVQSASQLRAATTILTATPAPDLSQLLVALTSFHTNNLRYMVLLCSANTTRTIFDMVSRHNLESRRVRWLVVVEETYFVPFILYTLREGSMVGLATRVTADLYKIFSTYVNSDNQMSLEEVGEWRGLEERGTSHLRRPLFPDVVSLYRNLHGRQVVLATLVDNWPFVEMTYLEDGMVVNERGIDVTVIKTLGYYLNFTYRVVEPMDRRWGVVLEDGTVTGMVGEVANRRAHFAMNEITITQSRETVVDFTYPYFIDSTTLTSKAPEEKNRSLAIFYPFSFLVWIILVLVTLLMGWLGYLLSRVHLHLTQTLTTSINTDGSSRDVDGPSFDSGRNGWILRRSGLRGVEMFCFNVFRTIIIQGNLLPASSWPLRLFFFSWYAFCVILYAVYAGTLTAYLTKPSFDKPIDSLVDLLEAKERGVVATVTTGTSNEMILKTATSGIFKAIYDTLDPSRSFSPSRLIGFADVVKKNTAYMSGWVGSEIYAIKQGRELFHLARNTFNPQGYGIACHTGSPYTPTLNLMLGRMIQAGLVGKWHKDEVTNFKMKQSTNKGTGDGQQGEGVNVGQGRIAVRALALDHLQGAFYILGFGALLAACILFIEILIHLLI